MTFMNRDKNSSCVQKGNCRKVSIVPKVFCRSHSKCVCRWVGALIRTVGNKICQNWKKRLFFSLSFYTLKNWQQKPGFNKFSVLQFFFLEAKNKQKIFYTSFLWLKIIIMWRNQMSKKGSNSLLLC